MVIPSILYLINVSRSSCGLAAKLKAQKDWGSMTSIPFLTSTGGWVKIGAALPKNGYVYLKKHYTILSLKI